MPAPRKSTKEKALTGTLRKDREAARTKPSDPKTELDDAREAWKRCDRTCANPAARKQLKTGPRESLLSRPETFKWCQICLGVKSEQKRNVLLRFGRGGGDRTRPHISKSRDF